MTKVNIFVSFDLEHDADLYRLLLKQSGDAVLGFEISGRSEASAMKDPEGAALRLRIRKADQIIFICGEHTDVSVGALTELRIAQEERKPYFLLWGRRDSMCTKPSGAKSSEGIYGWTYQILRDQITLTTRNAELDARTSGLKRQAKSPAKSPAKT